MTAAVLASLVRTGSAVTTNAAWPRVRLGDRAWRRLSEALGHGGLDLVALWGEPGGVHAAVRQGADGAIFTRPCPGRAYPSIGRHHAPAIRLERALQDLTGLRAEGLPDARPWLDHGRWDMRHPLGAAEAPTEAALPYGFLPVEGDGLHEIPVGPVHAGVIEPGHFRFTANGETIVRLEARLGYTHRGAVALMAGQDLAGAARIAARICGDSTVAYAYAFALAAEAALRTPVPERARWLRALMAELERLANHLGDVGAICNDASFAILHAHTGILREQILRASSAAFGHRLMMDAIVPGGVACDLHAEGQAAIAGAVAAVRKAFPALVEVYDETNSLQDRTVGTGVVRAEWVERFAAGGFIGRAAGRPFDARRWAAYAPYDRLVFDVPVLTDGDVNARVWVRIREIEQSLKVVDQILERMPAGPLRQDPGPDRAEGAALVEGFRGDVFVWLRLTADGRVSACHVRDPSWFQWPLLEAAVEGNIVADFPLCNKSFNCAYSGHDG